MIHNILRKEIPEGATLPVSATMLKHSGLYDQSLEEFSFPRLKLIRYERDQENQIRVVNETNHLYKYPDLTEQTKILFQFIQISLKEELEPELKFLKAFDVAEERILQNFDLPENKVNLFLRLCYQNQGRLSANKRSSHFRDIPDSDLKIMEEIFCQELNPTTEKQLAKKSIP